MAGSHLREMETTRRSSLQLRAIVNLEMNLSGLDHVAIAVKDVARSAAWYVDVLGLERMYADEWGDIPTFVGTGETGIALFPRQDDIGSDRGILHIAFGATAANFLAAKSELKNRGIQFQFEDHGISHSIYFRDPDGHQLELTTYDMDR